MKPLQKAKARISRNKTPETLFGLLAVSTTVVAGWFGYEMYLLHTDKKPITWHTRNLVNAHRGWAEIVAFGGSAIGGVAFCHFFVDAPCQPWGKD